MFAIGILIVLILVNAFFAASEIALISLNDNKVKAMADAGDRKARLIFDLIQEPSRFLATIQIGITLAGFLASAFAADSFSEALANWAIAMGVPMDVTTLDTIAVVVITLILSYFTLVFGELVPKRLAMKKAEAISSFAVRPLIILSKVTSPFVKLLTFSTNVTVRLFGVDPNEEDEKVTEEEIRMMVDLGKEKGAIQENEKMMIHNVLEFNNKDVADIMMHRTQIAAIPSDATLEEVIKHIQTEQYTRYPVYSQSIDTIIGVLHVKEMMPYLYNCEESDFDLMKMIHKPYHIPDSKRTDEVFRELQNKNIHMAIVIDEYGGTAGIITIEDLLEEIVGQIFDEYDEEHNEIVKAGEHGYVILGYVSLIDVGRVLKIDMPTEDYETISGFMIGQLGRWPSKEETPEVTYNGYTFKVIEMGSKMIKKVKVMEVMQ